jgi:hypothetical protein
VARNRLMPARRRKVLGFSNGAKRRDRARLRAIGIAGLAAAGTGAVAAMVDWRALRLAAKTLGTAFGAAQGAGEPVKTAGEQLDKAAEPSERAAGAVTSARGATRKASAALGGTAP